jgi:putative Mn2+ efflux pump MntP
MARTPARKGDAEAPATRTASEARLPPHFHTVFFTTAALTVLCLVIGGTLAVSGPDTAAAREVISGCMTMAKIGFGAIVGLVGGRAL